MAVTHSATARDAATNAVTGTLGSGSKLVFRTSPSTVASPGAAAATLAMATPSSFSASTAGTAAAGSITSDTAATGNTAAVAFASLETSGAVIHIHCAVASSASDINMTNGLTVATGDTVSCSALTYCALSA